MLALLCSCCLAEQRNAEHPRPRWRASSSRIGPDWFASQWGVLIGGEESSRRDHHLELSYQVVDLNERLSDCATAQRRLRWAQRSLRDNLRRMAPARHQARRSARAVPPHGTRGKSSVSRNPFHRCRVVCWPHRLGARTDRRRMASTIQPRS